MPFSIVLVEPEIPNNIGRLGLSIRYVFDESLRTFF